MSEAIDCDGIGTTETNGSKEDKVRACGETISKNDSNNLPNEIWTDGLSAKRIRLAAHGAYKNIVFEPNAAYKNFIVLIAFVAAMMRKIESHTWWWFDGMMKFDNETNLSSCVCTSLAGRCVGRHKCTVLESTYLEG